MTLAERAEQLLAIDAGRAVERLVDYIRRAREPRCAGGVLMGLSGGLDSAVLASLAVRALGRELVHVVFLGERDTDPDTARKSRLVAEWQGLAWECEDITPEIRAKGHYSSGAMRATARWGFLNRHVLYRLYRLVTGEMPFMSTLRNGDFDRRPVARFTYRLTIRHVEAAFNGRQLHRREVIERRASAAGACIIGAANRSEGMTGWFVPGGADDMPFQPLMGLYKTQVRQLARHLGVPEEIIRQAPSPDMMRGVTDEVALGIAYEKLDIVLDGIERGRTDEELMGEGLRRREIRLVREMNRLSEWKRNPAHVAAVDGGIGGGLRMNGDKTSAACLRQGYGG
ncbi:MAG TPA: NAD(+) synthase [Phycisphaerae bacterium]|nr:NAD(+) synthase [Phycisphaerae bacterium]